MPASSRVASLVIALTSIGCFAHTTAAQDRVVLVTGVALEGEIKQASRGELSFDNEELDVVAIDLVDVVELTSPSFFEVTDEVGNIYLGSLAAADSGTVVVGGNTIALAAIVEILAFDAGFWGRTSGHLDIGANLAAANSLSSILIGGVFAYRGPRWGTRHAVDAYWQEQTTTGELGGELVERTRRAALNSTVSRYFAKWAAQASGDLETNDELELDSRLQLGLQGIYSFVQNQSLELGAGTGLVSNTETYLGEESATSVEVVVGAVLDIFDIGDVDVYSSVTSYANINEGGRLRLNIDGRIAWEVIDDFFIGFNIVERLDNRPPSDTARKRDFQYGLTLGWSWS